MLYRQYGLSPAEVRAMPWLQVQRYLTVLSTEARVRDFPGNKR